MSPTDPASSDPPPPSGGDGAALVVVANRLPVDLVVDDDGTRHWHPSPGGLVTALEPTLRAHHGAWVGWPGAPEVEPDPFDSDGLAIHPVGLSAAEVAEHYEGFANATLWPLYHDVVARPVFDRDWWRTHRAVNERFADAAAAAAAPGATVWVQDYQLQLVPRLLRERRPDLVIGFFLHIPFPPPELFAQLPWRGDVVDGLLGADLVGFQTAGGAENFRRVAHRLRGAEPDGSPVAVGRTAQLVDDDGRTVTVGAYPISIDSGDLDRLARSEEVRERAAALRRDLGDPRTILLGVDRLDYTKGIDVRLAALHELFDAGRLDPRDTVLVQVATPSRERVEHYRRMRDEIELEVGRINGVHAGVGRPVVHYLHRSLPPEELAAFYQVADVMLVTPYRDGMNLVAKEFVAARHDGHGALVLSEFTGAVEELRDGAHVVNPHDVDGVQEAILRAAGAPLAERDRRMAVLREQVLTHDVAAWSTAFLRDLGVSLG